MLIFSCENLTGDERFASCFRVSEIDIVLRLIDGALRIFILFYNYVDKKKISILVLSTKNNEELPGL